MKDKEKLLEGLPFWKDLSPEQREYAESSSFFHHYDKGDIIQNSLYSCMGLIILISGEVRTYILSEEGREITLYRLYSGAVCVLSATCVINQITFETEIAAVTDCEVLVVSAGAFSQLCRNNIYVRCFMYETLTERFSDVMWSMQQILFKGFDHRLAAFFVEEYDRTGSKEICMTHEEIARNTSSAREVVARMLKRFSGEGLVSISRGRITLTDIDALRQMQ